MIDNTIKKRSDLDFFVEKRLLQALYFQNNFLDKVNEETFSSSVTRNVYKSIINLLDKNISLTRDALLQEFSLIDLDASSNIIDLITTPQNEKLESIEDILIQLDDFKKRRNSISSLKKAINEIEKTTRLSDTSEIIDIINEAEQSLHSTSSNIKKVMNMEEWFEDYSAEFVKRRSGKQFFFRNFILDSLIPDGPRPGEIGIISSQSGAGKSTLILNVVSDFIDAEIPCMLFSLEMSSIATMDRLISKRLGIKYSEIVNPKEQSDFDSLEKQVSVMRKELSENLKFRFSEDADLSLNDIKKHIQKFQTDIKQNYCVIAIDLLSMVKEFCITKGGLNFAQSVELGMNKLSVIAKELGVHFIGVLQLNRSSESEGKVNDIKDLQKFKPNRAQIKNAGAYLERSRYVINTFRPKVYAELFLEKEEYEDMVDIIEIQVAKINNGQLKKISALFSGPYFSIDPLPETETLVNEF